jgi:hypothetical protein
MKHKLLKLGIIFLAVGVIALAFSFTQTRININRMTAADWQQTHLTSIGVKTGELVLKSEPVVNVEDLAAVKGIGTVKVATLERHFCTYDTVRFEIFIIALSVGIAFMILGALLIFYVLLRRKMLANSLRKDISIIAGK